MLQSAVDNVACSDSQGKHSPFDDDLAQENARLIVELARSNEELSRFTSMVAHDLKAPLRHIKTFTGLLLDPKEQDAGFNEQTIDYIQKISASCTRMEEMFDGLLTFAQVGGGELTLEDIDLGEVLSVLLAQVDEVIKEANVDVRVENLPTIRADRVQMSQVLQNLLENTLKYRNMNGERPIIDISSRLKKAGAALDDESVAISLRDNGIGFDNKYAEEIFEPMRRLVNKADYPGSGIGLATVKKIVARHNGLVEAVGELGVGATFTVTLPIRQ